MKLTTTMAALAAAAIPISASANLLVNPGFELDSTMGESMGATGWDSFGAAFVNQALANSGSNGFKTFGIGGISQTFPVMVGDTVNGEAFVANASFDPLLNDQVAAINLEFLDLGGNIVGDIISNRILTSASPADSEFVFGTVSAPAPAGSVAVRFVLVTGAFDDVDMSGGVSGGGAPFYDDAALTIQAVPEPATLSLLAVGGLAALRRRRS